jgi:hypothetical protein
MWKSPANLEFAPEPFLEIEQEGEQGAVSMLMPRESSVEWAIVDLRVAKFESGSGNQIDEKLSRLTAL